MDANWLFHTFNHLVFGGKLTIEEIKLKIWDFVLRNKNTYLNILEINLETYIQNMRKNRVWEHA